MSLVYCLQNIPEVMRQLDHFNDKILSKNEGVQLNFLLQQKETTG